MVIYAIIPTSPGACGDVPYCLRMRTLTLTFVALLASFGSALALAASLQLTILAGQQTAQDGSRILTWTVPPQSVGGHLMVPLRQAAALLGLTDWPLPQGGWQVGELRIEPGRKRAELAGKPLHFKAVYLRSAGHALVDLSLLADQVSADLLPIDGGQGAILTFQLPVSLPAPLQGPQAHFTTLQASYPQGSAVQFVDRSFDPQGKPLTASWTGRRSRYLTAGSHRVCLTVSDPSGQSASRCHTVVITPVSGFSAAQVILKHGAPGDTFFGGEPKAALPPTVLGVTASGPTLFFSDSPERVLQSGLLYQAPLSGAVRVFAYHLDGTGLPARLLLLASNPGTKPVTVRLDRLGWAAGSSQGNLVGQSALLGYLGRPRRQTWTVQPGQSQLLFASPLFAQGSVISLLGSFQLGGRLTLSTALVASDLQVGDPLAQLPLLPADRSHIRGTFPQADRTVTLGLQSLPAELAIGSGDLGGPLLGTDAVSGRSVELKGNFGVEYRLLFSTAQPLAVALESAGGQYQGAALAGSSRMQLVPLPARGLLAQLGEYALISRIPAVNPLLAAASSDRIDLIPAPGSDLPVNLFFSALP